MSIVWGGFLLLAWFHSSVLHGDRRTAGCKVHTNFADESACLMPDNIWNKVVIVHRSQKVLKMLSLFHRENYVKIFTDTF
jgi:hypothetical protein